MGAARETAERAYAAMNAHDLDAFMALCAPDCKFQEVDIRLQGHEQIRPYIEAYFVAMPDVAVVAERLLEDGDRVAAETRFTGTHTGPLATPAGDIPPTGNSINIESADFIILRDGKIASWRVYLDMADFMRQLGPTPQASAQAALSH